MFDQEQGGRLFRLLWIIGIRQTLEDPPYSWIAPWEDMERWEQTAVSCVYAGAQAAILDQPDYYLALSREQGGQLIRTLWVEQLQNLSKEGVLETLNPSHVRPWAEIDEWERKADRGIFEHIRAVTIPDQLIRQSLDNTVWLAEQAINNVYKIALAGPYAEGDQAGPYVKDEQVKAQQKAAALTIAEQFALAIVQTIKKAEAKARSEERETYKLARKVASGFLAHIRMDLQHPDFVKYSEQVAILNNWYAQTPNLLEVLKAAHWMEVDSLHTPNLEVVLFDQAQQLVLELPGGSNYRVLQRDEIEALARFLDQYANVAPLVADKDISRNVHPHPVDE